MSEPTPGEWRYTNDGRLGHIVADGPDGEIDIAQTQMRAPIGRKDPEREANAWLMAASKRLLEACQAMLATWGSDDEDAIIRARDMAIGAIKYARGGES